MTRSISDKLDHTVLFQGYQGQFLGYNKWPGLDIWKKSLLNDQYYLLSNPKSLERPGLIIESLEYAGTTLGFWFLGGQGGGVLLIDCLFLFSFLNPQIPGGEGD